MHWMPCAVSLILWKFACQRIWIAHWVFQVWTEIVKSAWWINGLKVDVTTFGGFPSDSVLKNLPVNAGDLGSIPVSGRSPGGGGGNPLQCPCLENPMDRGALRATVQRVAKSRTRLNDWAYYILNHQGKDQLHWTYEIDHSEVFGTVSRHDWNSFASTELENKYQPYCSPWHVLVEAAQGQHRLQRCSAWNGCSFSLLDEVLEGQFHGNPFQKRHIFL